jgi:general secretion pathway protein G
LKREGSAIPLLLAREGQHKQSSTFKKLMERQTLHFDKNRHFLCLFLANAAWLKTENGLHTTDLIWQQNCLNKSRSLKEVLMNKKGFTLIELLIVVAIIGIIAAIAIPNLLVALQKGKQKATMADMKSVGTALEIYSTDNTFLPNATIPVVATATYFIPFYIKVVPLTDSWGMPWTYDHPNDSDQYSVTSLGRNKTADAGMTDMYQVTELKDFNYDITFSNGQFTLGPVVKK